MSRHPWYGCSVSQSISLLFSLGNFIKHFPLTRSVAFLPRKVPTQTVSGASLCTKASCYQILSSRQHDQINLYVDTLLHWNQKMNLTAVKDTDEVMERHIQDSLAILSPIKSSYTLHCNASCDDINVVDVGSGAGLPGLVLAIACPGWTVTLLESMNKRCVFLEHVVSATGLSNVKIVRGRAENFGHDVSYRENFDVAIARAVAEMRVLAEYCLPLVRVGGLFVAAKGHDPQEEARSAENSVHLMGGTVLQICPVESHSPYGQRTAIVCLKHRPTPRKYPRDPGTPAKTPL